jgi:hypothetical protein
VRLYGYQFRPTYYWRRTVNWYERDLHIAGPESYPACHYCHKDGGWWFWVVTRCAEGREHRRRMFGPWTDEERAARRERIRRFMAQGD